MTENRSPASETAPPAITPEHQAALDRVAAQDIEISDLKAQLVEALDANASLKEQLSTLKRIMFERRSERHVGEPAKDGQGEFLFDTEEEAEKHAAEVKRRAEEAEAAKSAAKKMTKNHGPRRQRRPRTRYCDLERVVMFIDPIFPACPPDYEMVPIDDDTCIRLDYIPGRFRVIEEVRRKWVVRKIAGGGARAADQATDDTVASPGGVGGADVAISDCVTDRGAEVSDVLGQSATIPNIDYDDVDGCGYPSRVYQALARKHIVEGGTPTESLLAHIAVSKYADGLPLYRQAGMFSRSKVYISRQTMANWMCSVAGALKPLAERIFELIISRDGMFADETVMPTQKRGLGHTQKCWFWTFGVDETTHGGTYPRLVAFKFDPSRGAEFPIRNLNPFSGNLQVDGYEVYEKLVRDRIEAIKAEFKDLPLSDAERKEAIEEAISRRGIRLVNCWSHARRYFYKAHVAAASEVTTRTLELMKTLWEIEDAVRGHSPDVREAARVKLSEPIVKELFNLWEDTLPRVRKKGKLAEAIRYALKRRKGLEYFLHDGRTDIDSNFIERTIRPQTIVRNNSLFAGSEGGGTTWSIIATLLETARLNDVDPYAWLAHTLECLANRGPNSNIDDLLPFNFKPEEPSKTPPPDRSPEPRKYTAGAGSPAGESAASPYPRAA